MEKIFHFAHLKPIFFYFTHLFLQNTHINLSIIQIYSNKIFISLTLSSLSQTKHNPHSHHHQPPPLSRSMPSASHYATRLTLASNQKKKKKLPVKKTPKNKPITPESTQPIDPHPQSPIPPTHTHNHYHSSHKLNQKTKKTNPTE